MQVPLRYFIVYVGTPNSSGFERMLGYGLRDGQLQFHSRQAHLLPEWKSAHY